MNCNSTYNCGSGCPVILSGRCVKYSDRYLEALAIGPSDTFNSAMIKIDSYLQSLPTNVGLQQVYTQPTSTITFGGLGTQSSPLVANFIGTVNNTLQQVTNAGSTTSNLTVFTGFDSPQGVTGIHIGYLGSGTIYSGDPVNGISSGLLFQGAPINIQSSGALNFTSTNGTTAIFNVKIKAVEGTDPDDVATVSQLGTGGGEPLWIASSDEQVVTTIGTINNLGITSNLIRFTGTSVVLTGIATQTTRAKTLMLLNTSGVDINIQHLSNASSSANQIFIPGVGITAGNNVTLGNNSAVKLDYADGKWRVTNWFGDGFHPNLIGTGTRVIEVLPNGKEQATASFDYEIYRPDITTAQTDAQLNVLYPGALLGTKVYAWNITPNGILYSKVDEVANTWVRINLG